MGCVMKRNLSTAIRVTEREEKKTKVDWEALVSWQSTSWLESRGQKVWIKSSMVSGMMNRHSNMLDMDRLAIRMFRVVSCTFAAKIKILFIIEHRVIVFVMKSNISTNNV